MQFNKITSGIIIFLVWCLGYFLGNIHYEYVMTQDNTRYLSAGFYRKINERQYDTPQVMLQNTWDAIFDSTWTSILSKKRGTYYCEQVRSRDEKLERIGGSYMKIGSDVFAFGKKITECDDDTCVLNAEIADVLYDGKNTFYRGKLLSGFDYQNLKILNKQSPFWLLTDERNTYYEGISLTGFDWKSFSQPNIYTEKFQDKNYIYKFVSSPTTGSYIVRTERDSGL